MVGPMAKGVAKSCAMFKGCMQNHNCVPFQYLPTPQKMTIPLSLYLCIINYTFLPSEIVPGLLAPYTWIGLELTTSDTAPAPFMACTDTQYMSPVSSVTFIINSRIQPDGSVPQPRKYNKVFICVGQDVSILLLRYIIKNVLVFRIKQIIGI